MAQLGTKWIDDLVTALRVGGTLPMSPMPGDLGARTAASLKELVRDHNAAQSPLPTPARVFQQPGWMAVRYDALPAPMHLAAAGVKWVAAILSHGIDGAGGHSLDTDDRENQAWLAAGKADAYRASGVKVGAWGWGQGFQPETEAWNAATYVAEWSLDLWIANGEQAWKGNDQPTRYAAQLASRLAQPALRIPASFPVGWSVLGAAVPPNVFPFDYKAFTSRGWSILPQAYPQQSLEYKLSTVVDHAVKARIPLELVHPTIANFPPQGANAYQPTLVEWMGELQAARARGVVGFSVWAHDFTADAVLKLTGAVA